MTPHRSTVPDEHPDQPAEHPPAPTVSFTLRPIGLVRATPKTRLRNPKYFVPKGRATLELFHPYLPGLQGLYGGLEVWVLTYQPPSGQGPAEAPQLGDHAPGVFATTALERPNPIEFLRARVLGVDHEQGLLQVEGLEAQDGAPILDIRPVTAPHHGLSRSAI